MIGSIRIIVWMSLLWLQTFFGQGSFDPFKLDHVAWTESGTDSNQPPHYYNWYYKICGDTTITSTTYKKVYSATVNTTNLPPWQQPTPVYGVYGFFRQDSATKSNYLRLPSMNKDSLLCNYSLQVGDTLKGGHYSYNSCGPGHVVLKTDSLLIGAYKFRILYTDTGSNGGQFINGPFYDGSFLIEGLGHDYGTMLDWYCPPFEAGVRSLQITFDTVCSSVAGIKEFVGDNRIQLRPNPCSSKIEIHSDAHLGRVQLFGSFGNLVAELVIDQNKEEVDVTQLPPGIYALQIHDRYYKVVKE